MTDTQMTDLEAYTKIGEQGGHEALALVATLQARTRAESDWLLDQIRQGELADAGKMAVRVRSLLADLQVLNERLDSMKLNDILVDYSDLYQRAASLIDSAERDGVDLSDGYL